MHRSALVLSLSCAAIAAVAACGNSASGGGTTYAGGGTPAGTAGGAGLAAGGAGSGGLTSVGAGGATAAGAGGVAVTGGSGGASAAGAGGSSAGAGGVSSAGTGGVSGAGTAGMTSSAGGTGRQPAVPNANGVYGHPDPSVTLPTYPGFKPYLVEDFSAPIDLDQDPFWTWGDGALFDGQTHMVEKNITFENGHMVISLTNEPVSGGYSFSAADNVADKPISSGEFRTLNNEFRYGRYEVSMKSPPGGNHNFLHTMFAYRAPAYLLWRELDIELTAGPQNNFISNIIVAPKDTRVWNGGIEDSTRAYPYPNSDNGAGMLPGGFDTSTQFHTYAFEWLPTSVKWFVDGQLVRVKLDGQGKNNLVIPKESTKIIMNMWVFGNTNLGGGDPANNTGAYPIRGEYDYFRYYRWDTETTYPCPNTHACLTDADKQWAKNNPKDGLPDIRPPLCTGALGKLDTACGP